MAIDQENTDTADAPARSPRKGGTTFETLAVCGFIFGMFAIAAAVFAVGLAARAVSEAEGGGGGGGEATAASGGPTVQAVTLGDFFIDPADATIASGAVLDLTNEGAVEHDLAIGDVVSDKVAPGESGTFDTAGVEPGSYEWYCTVPGHKEAGMTGTVTVE